MNNYVFLTIGKTQESTEASQGFKRYIGVGSAYVVAVNPTKEELEKIEGREIVNMPDYVVDTEDGKEARVMFVVKTDPESNGGIEFTQRVTFTLRNEPDYNRDKTSVRVIDRFGNSARVNVEDAKNGVKLASNLKIDQTKYRMACRGEVDLVSFLKTYLCVPSSLNYVNGTWTVKDNADADCLFGLDEIKKYFQGDFSEVKSAIKLQPNNKIKLLFGVRTADDNRQYQSVAARADFFLRNSAGSSALNKLEKDLKNAKDNGAFPTTEFEVCELKEYEVQPTNLENKQATASTDSSDDMLWD